MPELDLTITAGVLFIIISSVASAFLTAMFKRMFSKLETIHVLVNSNMKAALAEIKNLQDQVACLEIQNTQARNALSESETDQ